MIVKPTVNELLEHVENRFALVIATSKRARQVAGGDEKLTEVQDESPVTIAANEINEKKVVVCTEEDILNGKFEEENEQEDEEVNEELV